MTTASGPTGTRPIVTARDWWAGGRIERLRVGGDERAVFVREAGRGRDLLARLPAV